jgi:hypothetical protein
MHLLDGEREGSRRYNFDAGAKRHVVSRKPCLSIFRLWRESMRFGKEQLYEGLGPCSVPSRSTSGSKPLRPTST